MTYFLELSTIVWIVGLTAVAIVVYGFMEAELAVKTEWKRLERRFGTEKFNNSNFGEPRLLANGLMKINDAAIGVNVRIVGEGILIKGVRSSLVLLPWAQVKKANHWTAGLKEVRLLLQFDEGKCVELSLPWSPDFPNVE